LFVLPAETHRELTPPQNPGPGREEALVVPRLLSTTCANLSALSPGAHGRECGRRGTLRHSLGTFVIRRSIRHPEVASRWRDHTAIISVSSDSSRAQATADQKSAQLSAREIETLKAQAEVEQCDS